MWFFRSFTFCICKSGWIHCQYQLHNTLFTNQTFWQVGVLWVSLTTSMEAANSITSIKCFSNWRCLSFTVSSSQSGWWAELDDIDDMLDSCVSSSEYWSKLTCKSQSMAGLMFVLSELWDSWWSIVGSVELIMLEYNTKHSKLLSTVTVVRLKWDITLEYND